MLKLCSNCKEKKELVMFSKNKHTKDGLNTWCKACNAILAKSWRKVESNKERVKQWRSNNIEKCTAHARKSNLNIKYNMSIKEYNVLLEAQNNKCLLCSKSPEDNGKALSVDHDHQTGKIRGLLCDNCNKGIGFLKENIETLKNAIRYLETHGG